MNSAPLRSAYRQVGLWVSLVVVAALMTLLFSLLGTITTSVVAGIILGASRRWQWQTIPVSLVFPSMGLTLAQAAKADLEVRQRISLAALCFGAFWAVYLLTLLVMALEKSNPPGTGSRGSRSPVHGVKGGPYQEMGNDTAYVDSDPGAVTAEPVAQLSLGDFEGTWVCEPGGPEGHLQKRMMRIADDKFALSVMNPSNCARLIAQGELKLEVVVAVRTLTIAATSRPESGPPR